MGIRDLNQAVKDRKEKLSNFDRLKKFIVKNKKKIINKTFSSERIKHLITERIIEIQENKNADYLDNSLYC